MTLHALYSGDKEQDLPALVLLPPLGPAFRYYTRLSEALIKNGVKNPIYLLTPDIEEDFSSLKDLINCYYEEISRHFSENPVILGGWSFGAYAAFLTAQQCDTDLLEDKPSPVKAVVQLDPPKFYLHELNEAQFRQHAHFVLNKIIAAFKAGAPELNYEIKIKFNDQNQDELSIEMQLNIDLNTIIFSDVEKLKELTGILQNAWKTLLMIKNHTGLEGSLSQIPVSQVVAEPPLKGEYEFTKEQAINWSNHISSTLSQVTLATDHFGLIENSAHAEEIAKQIQAFNNSIMNEQVPSTRPKLV